MNKRTRWLFGILCVLLTLFMIVGGLYSHFVFSPTGYREFKQAQTASIEQVNASMRIKPLSSQTDTPTTVTQPVPVLKLHLPPAPVPNLNSLDRSLQQQFSHFQDYYARRCTLIDRLGTSGQLTWQPSGTEWVLDFAPGTAQAILDTMTSSSTYFKMYPPRILQPGDRERFRKIMDRSLDSTEENGLMRDDFQMPDFKHFPNDIGDLPPWFNLAIARACVRGQHEKVASLIERSLRFSCAARTGRFPSAAPSFFQPGFLVLGEFEKLPQSVFTRAKSTVDAFVPDERRLAALRAAHAFRSAEKYLAALNDKQVDQRTNTWHYLLGSIPERTVANATKPVLVNQIEKLSQAWAQWTNPKAIKLLENQVATTCRVMNLARTPMMDYYENNRWSANNYDTPLQTQAAGVPFMRSARLTQLLLALAHYRHDQGHYPDSIQELVPAYLSQAFLEDPHTVWGVCRFTPPPASGHAEVPVIYSGTTYDRTEGFTRRAERPGQNRQVRIEMVFPVAPVVNDELREFFKQD